jgi:DUF4097 and DUF4098 domain-containing protein YvlB
MTGIQKNWWKIALTMIAAGIVLFILSFALGARGGYAYFGDGGLRFATAGENTVVQEMDIAPFDKVDVNVISANIEFVASDRYGIEMRLPANQGDLVWDVVDGKLTVNAESKYFSFYFMDFGFSKHYIKVYFPSDAVLNSIDLVASSGNIIIPKLSVGNARLKTSSGAIRADALHYDQATAQTSSGNITFGGNGNGNSAGLALSASSGNIKADASGCAKVDLGTKSGEVKLTGATSPSAELRVTASSGNAYVDVAEWKSLAVDVSSGNINITGKPSGATTANAKSGNVTMALRGEQRDFSYELSASSGTVRVGGQRMGNSARNTNNDAKNTIYAKTFSGNIRVDFN